MTPATRRTLIACAPALGIAALAPAHPWLEHTMARHMGLELPALFLLGCVLPRCSGAARSPRFAAWNAHGLPGLLAALCTTGFWMLPAALDQAVLHEGMALAKVASLVAAGAWAAASWPRAGTVLQAFFVLNGFWMMLAAGLLYQEAPLQLCAVYLVDQQPAAGRALVLWAVAGLALWLAHLAFVSRVFTQADDDASAAAATP